MPEHSVAWERLHVKDPRRMLLLGLTILAAFILWTAVMNGGSTPFLGYTTKFSLFFRSYRQFGVTANHLLPAYNFQQFAPPSNVYLSKSPLLPLIMYGAATIFGDNPSTYRAVIIAINACLFGALSFFAGRWWGMRVAVWTLFFSALSTHALYYGSTQTFEQMCVLGMISAIFLYFEWARTRKACFLALGALAYLVGFAADYLAFFAGLVICLHWLFLIRNRTWAELLEISFFPILTVGYTLLMIFLMQRSGLQLQSWWHRAMVRATGYSWSELFGTLCHNLLAQIGPTLVLGSVGYFISQCREADAEAQARFRLEVLWSLLIAGLCPIMVFRNAYIEHSFWTMFVVPFLAVSGALLVDKLLAEGAWRKYLAYAIVLGFVATSARGAGVITKSRLDPHPALQECVAQLASDIRSRLGAEDRLLVLRDEATMVTAFYVLGIPTTGGTDPRAWHEVIERKDYSLVLCADPETFGMLADSVGTEILGSDGYVAFFKLRQGRQ